LIFEQAIDQIVHVETAKVSFPNGWKIFSATISRRFRRPSSATEEVKGSSWNAVMKANEARDNGSSQGRRNHGISVFKILPTVSTRGRGGMPETMSGSGAA
jgi:hypothetical protein